MLRCDVEMSSQCTKGCVAQLESTVLSLTTDEFKAAIESNKQTMNAFFSCAADAKDQPAFDDCLKFLDANWQHVECDNVVDWEDIDAHLANFEQQLKAKLAKFKDATQAKIDEFSAKETLLYK